MTNNPIVRLVIFFILLLPSVASGGTKILHSFGVSNDGRYPHGTPTLYGGRLYGTTMYGGNNNNGTIFSLLPGGSGYAIHQHLLSYPQGREPMGSLLGIFSQLFGLTSRGGSDYYRDIGVLFRIGTDGQNYTNLHDMGSGASEGGIPKGSLTLVWPRFYGTTGTGGPLNCGTLFSCEGDGSDFTAIHHFDGSLGCKPFGSLLEYAGKLYGTTTDGGMYDQGVIFRIGTDGTGYDVIHHFYGGLSGGNPHGGLIYYGGYLYGMTTNGADTDEGTIFRILPSGSGYAVLHRFGSSINDGLGAYGDLLEVDEMLYGMTSKGGVSNLGTLFRVAPDGSNYSVMHNFAGSPGDGATPVENLIESGGTFYGMTYYGGAQNLGSVFSFVPGLFSDAVDLGSGWRWLAWFGYFNINNNPWIYHVDHGWMYPFGASMSSITFWDSSMNEFWWTSDTQYPYLYRFSDGEWLWYQEGSSNPRWFVRLSDGQWEGW